MHRSKISRLKTVAAAVTILVPAWTMAQTCHEPAAGEFKVVKLTDVKMGLEELPVGAYGPVQMAIAPDGRVFIAKMKTGEIRVYKPTTANPATVDLVGTIPTWFSTEDGLLGIALDPNFETNHWLYASYSDPCGKNCPNRAMEVARFTITDNKLGPKKVILRVPRATDDDHHAAGGLTFDDKGVLIIGVGDNTDPHDGTNKGFGPFNTARAAADAQKTSANTNDLRGKILRIKPLAFPDAQTPAAGVGTTYEIPAGNLWERINDKAFNPGWDAATDDMTKVRKEIFSFGHRNPYHPRVDSKSGWIFWGEVGPDAATDTPDRGPAGHDEWNLATGPGFFGHPYCNGYNVAYNMMTGPGTYGAKHNCAATVNNSPHNTGIRHMPPARPALVAYTSGNSTDDDPRFNSSATNFTTIVHGGETAIGGPMYRYDPNLASPIKFPPYFEGKILFFDWARRNFRVITMNTDGTIPAGTAAVRNFAATGLPSGSYIDMQFGPDGAMYLLKFSDGGYSIGAGPQLLRVEYTGAPDAACYKPFVAGTTALAPRSELRSRIAPVANGLLTLPQGYRSIALFDAGGRQVWSYQRESAGEAVSLRLPQALAKGIWQSKLMP